MWSLKPSKLLAILRGRRPQDFAPYVNDPLDLPRRPRRSCTRLRLGLGDALVMRNAGGRITPAVMRDLGILGVLAAAVSQPRTRPMRPELVVIHHTDCGMSRLANPAIQGQVAKRLGLSVDEVSAMAISDPIASVQDDVKRLRDTPGTPDQLVVSGFVYDVSNGTVNQVVPPAPLRASRTQG